MKSPVKFLLVFLVVTLSTSNIPAEAGGIGVGKACSNKDFLKTVQSGGQYLLCAEGNGGLQWFTTEAPAKSKAKNNAVAAKAAETERYKTAASKAWAQVANYAATVLQRAKTYDAGSTGHVYPNELRVLVYNLGISAQNASNAYLLAANSNASGWATKASSFASQLQNRKSYYQSQGEETMFSETSILLTYASAARGFNQIR